MYLPPEIGTRLEEVVHGLMGSLCYREMYDHYITLCLLDAFFFPRLVLDWMNLLGTCLCASSKWVGYLISLEVGASFK